MMVSHMLVVSRVDPVLLLAVLSKPELNSSVRFRFTQTVPLVVSYERQSVERISQFAFHPRYLPEVSVPHLACSALCPRSSFLIGAM